MKLDILGIKVDNLSLEESLSRVAEFLSSNKQHYIVLPYSEFLVKAQKDEEFRGILNRADLCLSDGIGPIIASRLLGKPLKKGRVRGVDLIHKIFNFSARGGPASGGQFPIFNDSIKIFLFGGKEGVAKLSAEKLRAKNPKLNIVGTEHGFHGNNSAVIEKINQTKPNILLVGLGFPKQEKWIYNNLDKMPSVRVAIGVGGAFDYISGRVRRAPRFMQIIGLEWLWRLMVQPSRLPRIYNAAVKFPMLILREPFSETENGSRSIKKDAPF